jgi:hypothetical protein
MFEEVIGDDLAGYEQLLVDVHIQNDRQAVTTRVGPRESTEELVASSCG